MSKRDVEETSRSVRELTTTRVNSEKKIIETIKQAGELQMKILEEGGIAERPLCI